MQLLRLGARILPFLSILHSASANPFNFDAFVKDIEGFGRNAKTLADNVLAAAGGEAVVLVAGLKNAAEELHTATATWYAEQERLVANMAPGTTKEDISAQYAIALGDARAELQKTFAARPPLAEEPASGADSATDGKTKVEAWKTRLYEDVSMILDSIEDAVVEVWRIWNAPEAQTRASFGTVKPFLKTVLVLAGKFAHEHPRFFKRVILPLLMTMLIPFVPKDLAFILFDIFVFVFGVESPFTAKL
ncbi:hypothetical protein HYPSUDRAFT_61811 [Hypholoma sublateritium FD-334 SS-4]|uniref:Uncharacterized protein n=1 Tax=Hypholoma sublateritium (strain FD-334 SS-4) TaxID=945553 RepID=A0A0D2QBC6_HYPSF|nr:hypothetical protein HYPSUDRAFT_61811 [Hypholoma sublateritium FD-334 SS-4]